MGMQRSIILKKLNYSDYHSCQKLKCNALHIITISYCMSLVQLYFTPHPSGTRNNYSLSFSRLLRLGRTWCKTIIHHISLQIAGSFWEVFLSVELDLTKFCMLGLELTQSVGNSSFTVKIGPRMLHQLDLVNWNGLYQNKPSSIGLMKHTKDIKTLSSFSNIRILTSMPPAKVGKVLCGSTKLWPLWIKVHF